MGFPLLFVGLERQPGWSAEHRVSKFPHWQVPGRTFFTPGTLPLWHPPLYPSGEEFMKFLGTLAFATAALTLAGSVSAQSFQKPEDAIKYRQGAFRVMAAHFGALGAMANNRAPFDAQAAARHGDVLAVVS